MICLNDFMIEKMYKMIKTKHFNSRNIYVANCIMLQIALFDQQFNKNYFIYTIID